MAERDGGILHDTYGRKIQKVVTVDSPPAVSDVLMAGQLVDAAGRELVVIEGVSGTTQVGIDADGDPYYDLDGAAPGEVATLYIDADGDPAVTRDALAPVKLATQAYVDAALTGALYVPPPPPVLAADTFNARVVAASDSWGTPDVTPSTGPWEISFGGSGANRFSVTGDVALFQTTSTVSTGNRLHPGAVDFDAKAKFKLSALPAGGSVYYGLFGRYRTITSAVSNVRARVRFNASNQILLMVTRETETVTTNSADTLIVNGQTTGWWWHRFQARGDTIKAKVWADGSIEPDWQLTMTHAEIAAMTHTDVGVRFPAASGTVLPVISVDEFTVGTP